MKHANGISRLAVLTALIVLCCLSWSAPVVAQTTAVQINGSGPCNGNALCQTIDGFGISEAWGVAQNLEALCDSANPAPQRCAEQHQILDLLFSPQTGAGLTMLRMMAPSDSHTIEPNNPGGPDLLPNYMWDHDVFGGAGVGAWGQLWLAKEAQTYGVSQFYLGAWSAPGFMKTNGLENGNGTLCNGTNCPADWRQAYANYLTQYLAFYQGDGVTVTHLGAFNEPDISISSNHSSEMQMSPGQAANFMEFLGRTASAAGFSPQIVCCEANSWGDVQGYINAIDGDANASPWVNVLSGHAYGGDHQGITSALTDPVNRHIWMTEWALGPPTTGFDTYWDDPAKSAGIYVAYTIQKDLTDAPLNAYFSWLGADVGNPAVTCFQNACNGLLIEDNGGTVTPAKRLWAMAQFSRYIHPGATRIFAGSGESNLLVNAFQNPDGTVAVVALNMESFPIYTSFSLQNVGSAINGTAAPFITDSYNNVSPQNGILVQNGQFSDRVAARALVTYVITPGNVPPPGQFVNLGSNMCMGVPGGSMSPIQLVQWWCNGSNDQNWLPDPNNSIVSGGLTYTHWIDQRSGMCIAVAGGSTSAGAAVVQWPCYPGGDQFWARVDMGGGYTELLNFSSHLCLGVSGGSLSAGAKIVQWYCYGPADQRWHYTAPHNLAVSFTGDGSGVVTSSAPPGLSCPNYCYASVNDQTPVTLTAAANPGSLFYGWTGACSGSQTTCTLVMNNDQNVAAEFIAPLPSTGPPPTPATGSVDVVGAEQTYTYLVPQTCYDDMGDPYDCSYYDTAYDTGTLYLTIGSYTTSIAYGQYSDAHNLAYWLGYQLNSDPASPVDVAPIDSNDPNAHTLYFTTRATGAAANYYVATNAVSDGGNVSPPSFGFSPVAFYLTGGN